MKICPLCNKEFSDETTCPDDGATLLNKSTLDDALIGKVLKDAYRIEEQIGAGGMGAVYRVSQIRLGRSVAVKVLLPKFHSTPDMVRRFFREAQILSQLNHPNIVSIIDFGNTEDGLIYMVMEYLSGQTLADFVPRKMGLSEHTILKFMTQICDALDAAHQIPLIHRDLKPGNIFIANMMNKENVVKILDFGIGKILGDADEHLTQTGILMGTPGYIAPEQISQLDEPGVASDIYALGGILYYMMGGSHPFSEHTGRSAIAKQLNSDPNPIPSSQLLEPGMQNLFPVVLKAMEREPNKRYPSAGSLLKDLRSRVSQEALSTMIDHGGARVTEATMPINLVQPGRKTTSGISPMSKKLAGGLLALGLIAALVYLVMGLGQTKQPLVFGMSADFSGSNRELGREMKLGIETAFGEINASGGVKGHELQLVALDDRYEPKPAQTNMFDLINEHKVFGFIGNVGTPTAKVAVPVALQHKRLFFGAFSGANILRRDPPERYVFNYRASYTEEAEAIVHYFVMVREVMPHRIAVFSQNDSFGDDGFEGVVKALREFGVKRGDILHVRYERNHFDVEEAAGQVINARDAIQAVVTVGTYKQTARFISKVKDQRPETLFSCISFVGARALAEEFVESDPTKAEGVIITQVVPYFNSGATGVLRYRDALQIHAPNESPGFVSLEGYTIGHILAEGLQNASKLETEAVIDALEEIHGLDLGMGSAISFGPSNHQASHKVWAVIMDDKAGLEELLLE